MNFRKYLPLAFVLLVPGVVLAANGGLVPAPAPAGTQPGNTDLVTAIMNIVNAFLVLASVAAVIFLILGGVRYIASQGNEDQATMAKNTILYAVIGLVVIGLAAVIANFVIRAVAST